MSENKIEDKVEDTKKTENTNIAIFKLVLPEPFTYEDKTISELNFNFGKLTGKDSLAIEDEIKSQGGYLVIPSLDGNFLIKMSARACQEKVSTDFLLALPLNAYNAIRRAARTFLSTTE